MLDILTKLSAEQKKAYDVLANSSGNYFVTGKAGTGKSFLLQYFVKHCQKSVAVVAPTGVAAINAGGQTIHAFMGLSIGYQNADDAEAVKAKMTERRRKLMSSIDTLVIDEISMVRADVMDMIDAKMRLARKDERPFGGCQLIVFGDLYQLPPVVQRDEEFLFAGRRYASPFFFSSDVISKNPFKVIELNDVKRQTDETFIELLNKVRVGDNSAEVLAKINERYESPDGEDEFIILTGNRAMANRINNRKLAELPGDEVVYDGELTGNMKPTEVATAVDLKLKVGAKVMMLTNDYVGNDQNGGLRWVNGSIGTVVELKPEKIRVRIGKKRYWVEPYEWDKLRYSYNDELGKLEQKVEGTFTQLPVRLAYAITIHKSQGKTYNAVGIDLRSGAFAAGQTYVALSRCRSLEHLYVNSHLKPSDIIIDPVVAGYLDNAEYIDIS